MATLFIIAAASGAGKTSLVNALLQRSENIIVSVSYTTRPKRTNEIEGTSYHFVSETEFQAMVDRNEFLEHATVFNYQYGTSKTWVLDQLNKGIDVLLEIDWQGAQQIRQQVPHATSIFILPPSLQTLRERLCKRGQDSLDVINYRFNKAQQEISHYREFDYLVVNDEFERALNDLMTIIHAERLRTSQQILRHQGLIDSLLLN